MNDKMTNTDAIEELQNFAINSWGDLNEAFNMAIKALENESQWVPCKERLPKESGKYLVTAVVSFIPDHIDDPNTVEAITTANYLDSVKGPLAWWGNNVEKVLAWMPLPEKYKETEV